jgi:hypothetical protein
VKCQRGNIQRCSNTLAHRWLGLKTKQYCCHYEPPALGAPAGWGAIGFCPAHAHRSISRRLPHRASQREWQVRFYRHHLPPLEIHRHDGCPPVGDEPWRVHRKRHFVTVATGYHQPDLWSGLTLSMPPDSNLTVRSILALRTSRGQHHPQLSRFAPLIHGLHKRTCIRGWSWILLGAIYGRVGSFQLWPGAIAKPAVAIAGFALSSAVSLAGLYTTALAVSANLQRTPPIPAIGRTT